MNKKLFYRIPILLFVLFWLIINIIQPWVDWPKVTLVISDKQESMSQSLDLYKYLGNWSIFFYFTVLTNIIVVGAIFISYAFNIKFSKETKTIIGVYSIITAGVFWISLAPFLPWGQSWYFDFIYIHDHSIIFIIYAFWCWDSETKKDNARYKWWRLFTFPLIYLVVQVIFYITVEHEVATYPFLHFRNYFDLGLPLAWSIILCILTIAAIAGLFALIYWWLEVLVYKWKRN